MRLGLVALALLPSLAAAYTVGGGRLVEDFSTTEKWDAASSTGLWTTAGARAGAVVAGDPARALDFGDGRDGALESASGVVTLDTDSRGERGFQFMRVSITGGSIVVTGSRPLVIRSLGSVEIVPELSVSGADGTSGTAGQTSGPAGATGRGGGGSGGRGGNSGVGAADVGADGLQSDGTADAGSGGAVASNNNFSAGGPNPGKTFETATDFVGGSGGGGGGGDEVAGSFSTGGSGGAGGGTIRIVAAGNVTLGDLDVSGGDGGVGVSSGAACSGNGGGGNAGAVWLQTPGAVSTAAIDLNPGNGPDGCQVGFGAAFGTGVARVDAASATGAAAVDNSTAMSAPSRSYVIQSARYDLGVLNPEFTASPSVTADVGGGAVSVSYAGSSDGTTFGDFTTDLASLSGRDYRYLKFRATITTASVAGDSPTLSRIEIQFRELGPGELKLGLLAGCGSMRMVTRSSTAPFSSRTLGGWLTFWTLALMGAAGFTRRYALEN